MTVDHFVVTAYRWVTTEPYCRKREYQTGIFPSTATLEEINLWRASHLLDQIVSIEKPTTQPTPPEAS